MADEETDRSPDLEPRDPTLTDLVALCRELNARKARYLVCGGFAIRAAGYMRHTQDIDVLMDASVENEAKVFTALEIFPDKAVLQLKSGEVGEYTVVRVADEQLLQVACRLAPVPGRHGRCDRSGRMDHGSDTTMTTRTRDGKRGTSVDGAPASSWDQRVGALKAPD